MFEAGALEPHASKPQHVGREVDAKSAVDLRPEQLEHAARARAEVEQGAQRAIPECRPDRAFHCRIGDMQPPNAIPFLGMSAEIRLRDLCSAGADLRQTLAVADQRRIAGIEACDERTGELRAGAAVGQAEEGPGTFAIALDQPAFSEQPQMPRNARLGLPKDFGQIRNGKLGFHEQREDTQPRRFCRGPQRAVQIAESEEALL